MSTGATVCCMLHTPTHATRNKTPISDNNGGNNHATK